MRVAYLSTDPGIAYGGHKGASVHMSEIVEALAAEGSRLLVLAARTSGAPISPGVAVEQLPMPAERVALDDDPAIREALVAWLVGRLRSFAPTIVYERLALGSSVGGTVAQALGVPHLLEVNAPLPDEAIRYRGLRESAAAAARVSERRAIEAADLVFVVSPPLAAYVAARGARRVRVLPNAADPDRFRPAPGRSESARPIAVFAGSMRPWHGIDTIAAAWRLLGAEAPELLVVGDGPAAALLRGAGARLTGAVEPHRVPELLGGADIGLAPYSTDAPSYFSPIKVFEYLAAGLATVAADLPAVTSLFGPDTVVTVPAGDPERLAAAVAGLAADPERRRILGRNGRARVRASHTWRHRARDIADEARRLMNGTVPA